MTRHEMADPEPLPQEFFDLLFTRGLLPQGLPEPVMEPAILTPDHTREWLKDIGVEDIEGMWKRLNATPYAEAPTDEEQQFQTLMGQLDNQSPPVPDPWDDRQAATERYAQRAREVTAAIVVERTRLDAGETISPRLLHAAHLPIEELFDAAREALERVFCGFPRLSHPPRWDDDDILLHTCLSSMLHACTTLTRLNDALDGVFDDRRS